MEKHLSIEVISCPGEKYEIVFTVTSYDGAFRGDIAEERSLDGRLPVFVNISLNWQTPKRKANGKKDDFRSRATDCPGLQFLAHLCNSTGRCTS